MSVGIERRRILYVILGLLLLAGFFWVWWPQFSNQFVMWDDDYNIYENPYFRSGQWMEFWKNPYMGFYIPVTYSVWAVLAGAFSQDHPLPFQILNLSFHLFNGFLLWKWLGCLRRRFLFQEPSAGHLIWTQGLCVLLFLVHPLQVGAVSWHSGFRDLLSLSFSWAALWLLFSRGSRRAWWGASLLFVAALLSKPASVYLPGLVLALSLALEPAERSRFWRWGGFNLFLAGTFVFWTRQIQSRFMIGLDDVPYLDRPFLILDSYGFYIRQFFLAGNFSVDYGRTPARVVNWGLWWDTQPWLWVFFALLILLFFRFSRQAWVFAALWLIPLSPTSGLVHFNFQRISTVADHYFMPAFPAFAFLLLFLVWRLGEYRIWGKKLSLGVLILLFGFILTAGVRTHERIQVWRNSESLFQDILSTTPYSHSANNYLGFFAYRRKDWPAAEKLFRQALASQPGSAIASGNLGYALIRQGRFEEARALLGPFLADPDFLRMNEVHRHVLAMNYLAYALALASLERYQDAFEAVCKVFAYNPEPRELRDAQETLEKLRPFLRPDRPEALQCPPLH